LKYTQTNPNNHINNNKKKHVLTSFKDDVRVLLPFEESDMCGHYIFGLYWNGYICKRIISASFGKGKKKKRKRGVWRQLNGDLRVVGSYQQKRKFQQKLKDLLTHQ